MRAYLYRYYLGTSVARKFCYAGNEEDHHNSDASSIIKSHLVLSTGGAGKVPSR